MEKETATPAETVKAAVLAGQEFYIAGKTDVHYRIEGFESGWATVKRAFTNSIFELKWDMHANVMCKTSLETDKLSVYCSVMGQSVDIAIPYENIRLAA